MKQATPTILVVDDNAATRAVYRDWIAAIGDVKIIEASGGQEAVAIARQHDFAMILLDIGMPDMDGFETAALLRQDPLSEPTPIVFISAEFNRNQRVRGYRMGAVDCLVTEPLDPEVVTQKARVFLQLFRKRQELQGALENTRRENIELHAKLELFVLEQDKLRRDATHDPLSGLPNRALFNDRVESAIQRAQRSKQHFALAYVDLDGFKSVNDTHGHATGDALIQGIAGHLSKSVRGTDTVARIGGDEFAMLYEGLDSAAAATYLAEKTQRVITQPLTLHSESQRKTVEVRVGASIGIALYPDHATQREDLAMLADMTMYAVKRTGGGTRVYNGNIGNEAHADHGAEPKLHLVRSAPPP